MVNPNGENARTQKEKSKPELCIELIWPGICHTDQHKGLFIEHLLISIARQEVRFYRRRMVVASVREAESGMV